MYNVWFMISSLARRLSRGKVLLQLALALSLMYWLTIGSASVWTKTNDKTIVEPSIKMPEAANSRASSHVVVVIPFRNAWNDLFLFVPPFANFLRQQNTSFDLWIINQADDLKFNRGALIDVGYQLSRKYKTADDKDDECLVIHDVDLLPLDVRLQYRCFAGQVSHLCPPSLHPRYHYPEYLGGILTLHRGVFEQLDGMGTQFWGWGKEDDNFAARIKRHHVPIQVPSIEPLWVNRRHVDNFDERLPVFKDLHNLDRRPRDKPIREDHLRFTRAEVLSNATGLSTLEFLELDRSVVKVGSVPMTVVNVQLQCNETATPWCKLD